MSTIEQIEANRRNSKNSTGPRTAAGKARSAMNALKTGIDAQSTFVRDEDPAKLQILIGEYYDRFHPTTPEQRMLVDVLIDSEWLLRRFRAVEAQLWELGALAPFNPEDNVGLAQAFNSTDRTFARLQRRIDTAIRNHRNALNDLKALQAEEAAELAAQADAEPQCPQPLTPEIGFVPQAGPDPLPGREFPTGAAPFFAALSHAPESTRP